MTPSVSKTTARMPRSTGGTFRWSSGPPRRQTWCSRPLRNHRYGAQGVVQEGVGDGPELQSEVTCAAQSADDQEVCGG